MNRKNPVNTVLIIVIGAIILGIMLYAVIHFVKKIGALNEQQMQEVAKAKYKVDDEQAEGEVKNGGAPAEAKKDGIQYDPNLLFSQVINSAQKLTHGEPSQKKEDNLGMDGPTFEQMV